ncbi:MAG: hypothetical protein ACI8ZM_005502 [Crocinitomix sp.]|jgi:hypothetical protein
MINNYLRFWVSLGFALKMHLRIVSTFLLFVTLIASVGLNLNAHICQGAVKSVCAFSKAPSCNTENPNMCVQEKHDEGFTKVPCCKDVSFFNNIIDGQITVPTLVKKVQFDFKQLFLASSEVVVRYDPIVEKRLDTWRSPPIVPIENFHSFYQIFLI